jgi:hypothetical protein
VGLKGVGLPENATDSEVVKVACERRIVVTCNGDDFNREFNSHLTQTKKTDCHDMYALGWLSSFSFRLDEAGSNTDHN